MEEDFTHFKAMLQPYVKGPQPAPFDKIAVQHGFFSPQQCDKIMDMADFYAENNDGWSTRDGQSAAQHIPSLVSCFCTAGGVSLTNPLTYYQLALDAKGSSLIV